MNYYELLGIKENATAEEIKQAYKKQMKIWHPDLNKSEEAISMSTKINEAKEVLLDEIKRADYDEYLKNKINEDYNKYTQRKRTTTTSNNNDHMVTKWEYLRDWIKYTKINPIDKFFRVLGVLLESLLCWIIKILLIAFAYTCNVIAEFIRTLISYLSPILVIMIIIMSLNIYQVGLHESYISNKQGFTMVFVSILLFILSLFLPLLSQAVLSPKVFNILYNKIDITLFKSCVNYKD